MSPVYVIRDGVTRMCGIIFVLSMKDVEMANACWPRWAHDRMLAALRACVLTRGVAVNAAIVHALLYVCTS